MDKPRTKTSCCVPLARPVLVWFLQLVLAILLLQPAAVQPLLSSASGSRRHQLPNDVRDRDVVDQNLLEVELDQYIRKLQASGARTDCANALTGAAENWLNGLDGQLKTLLGDYSAASWNYSSHLTDENAANLEVYQTRLDDWVVDKLPEARQHLQMKNKICNATAVRLLRLFANYMLPPVADDPNTRSRINQLVNSMSETYSTAFIADSTGKENRLDPELTEIMSSSRDYDRLLWAWQGWRDVTGRVMKDEYVELVEKMNEAARDNGYADVGLAWQMTDFDETGVEQMMLTLLEQIKPFYEQLHSYVRRKLIASYPNRDIRTNEPIPAHLLGDMWAQEWSNIADLVLPFPDVADIDVTEALVGNNFTALRMFQVAEDFFTSIGLEAMTSVFWDKSIIVRPADGRPLTCHGSAEDFFQDNDYRIKMCSVINANDFQTVHHEMGHIEYFMQYRDQPVLFRTGANAAFHEAIGDTIALSVQTPQHLGTIGLADTESSTMSTEQELNFLMKVALSKVAFLPFAFIVDKWRYDIFSGRFSSDQYNAHWWSLREQFQGLKAPVPRTAEDFDPAAKYHVPANVPYSRYFLSFIGQFQFQSALCKAKGHSGPLHTCDIYGSQAAGDKLRSVLSLGASQPWRAAMKLMTGQTEFQADAILEYFRPLNDWLKEQNRGHHVGW